MMKKVIATALCLTITAPCFAAGRYKNYYPNPNRMDCPRYEQGYDCRRDNHTDYLDLIVVPHKEQKHLQR